MRIGIVTIIIAAGTVSTTAYAEDGTGFYGAIRAGVQSTGDVDYSQAVDDLGFDPALFSSGDELEAKFKTKTSAVFEGALGYDFGMVRADIELTYGKNKIKSLEFTKVNGSGLTAAQAADVCSQVGEIPCVAGAGSATYTYTGVSLRQLSVLGSAWVDIPVGKAVQPYVGGGVGLAGYLFESDGNTQGKTRFAWQLGAGVAVPITSKLGISADYRFRHVKGANFPDDGNFSVGSLKTHQFMAGLRVGF